MAQIRIIADLPGDSLLKALHRQPYRGYERAKLKDLRETRLEGAFPDFAGVSVEIVANDIFFGIDVMGVGLEEITDVRNVSRKS